MTSPIEMHWVQRPGRSIELVHRPATLAEAIRLLADNPAAQPIAGGTDLLLQLARGGEGPAATLVDLSGIAGFTAIEEDAPSDSLILGGGVTHNDVVSDERIVKDALPLAQACLEIGSPQLRNRATVAGNLVTASPANDTISALMALDASLDLICWTGDGQRLRRVPVDGFFTGFRETVLEPHELISAIRVPRLTSSHRGIWVKLGLRKAQAISVVHAAIVVGFAEDESVTSARVALGSVAATVQLSRQAADVLVGSRLTSETIRACAEAAADSVTPIDDIRATAAYRSDAIVTVIGRSLNAIASNRQADSWPARAPRLSTRHAPLAEGRRSAQAPPHAAIDDATEITVTVNGSRVTAPLAANQTLLDWIRHTTGTGTKEGCAEGECGACTVQLDGDAVMSCLVSAAQADGASVTTIEGLAASAEVHPMQQRFVDNFAVQCGFCIPGFVMAASTLVDEVVAPSRAEVELGLSGNLCRCTGYYTILDAVLDATSEETQ